MNTNKYILISRHQVENSSLRTDAKETLKLDVTIINNYEKLILIGDTMSREKKNDHIFHNACLTHLIDFLDK